MHKSKDNNNIRLYFAKSNANKKRNNIFKSEKEKPTVNLKFYEQHKCNSNPRQMFSLSNMQKLKNSSSTKLTIRNVEE